MKKTVSLPYPRLGAVDAGVVLLVGVVPDGEGLAPRLELLHLLGAREAHSPR
jgi:hypothetical protein